MVEFKSETIQKVSEKVSGAHERVGELLDQAEAGKIPGATVADLDGAESVTASSVAEALRYRPSAGGAAAPARSAPTR